MGKTKDQVLDYLLQLHTTKYLNNIWDNTNKVWKDPVADPNASTDANAIYCGSIALLAKEGKADATLKQRAIDCVNRYFVTRPSNNRTWYDTLLNPTTECWVASHGSIYRGLTLVYKYRNELGISQSTADAIKNNATANWLDRQGSEVLNPNASIDDNQDSAYWKLITNFNAYQVTGNLIYVENIATIVRHFIQYMDTVFPNTSRGYANHKFLFSDFSWQYTQNVPYTEHSTTEYHLQASMGLIRALEVESLFQTRLTNTEWNKLRAFVRSMVGMVCWNGQIQFNSPYGTERSFMTFTPMLECLIVAGKYSQVSSNADDIKIAREVFGNIVDLMLAQDTWNGDVSDYLPGQNPYVVNQGGTIIAKPARNIVSGISTALEWGVFDTPDVQAPDKLLWGWQWHDNGMFVSSKKYNSAHIPYKMNDLIEPQSWGISRIVHANGDNYMTGTGGRGISAFQYLITNNGLNILDTNIDTPTAHSFTTPAGTMASLNSYDTRALDSLAQQISIKSSGVINGNNVEVTTNYYPSFIESTHKAVLGSTINGKLQYSIPSANGYKITYKAKDGTKTELYDGTTKRQAGAFTPATCRYIHIYNASRGVGFIVIPVSATTVTGAKVIANDGVASSTLNPNPGKVASIVIGESTISGTVELTAYYVPTDGTETDADNLYTAFTNADYVAQQKIGEMQYVGSTKVYPVGAFINEFKFGKSKLGHREDIIQSFSIYQTGTNTPIDFNSILGALTTGQSKTVSFDIKNEGNITLFFVCKSSSGNGVFSTDNLNFANDKVVSVAPNSVQTVYLKYTNPSNSIGSLSDRIQIQPAPIYERG